MKKILLLVVLVAAVALLTWATTRTSEPTWTTCCEDAAAAFDAALEANRRIYHDESLRHLERAIELDPNFAAARLFVAQARAGRTRDRSEIVRELESVDTSGLNEREQLFFAVARARVVERNPEAVGAILEAYLERHPDDPYAVDMWCERKWQGPERGDAEGCYERLLAIDPNWVSAQNRLGYLAIAQGRFKEAEERFITYRYIAPDQANPHDSLGELLMIQGRWEEAEGSLLAALQTHPEFCVSWNNLSDIGIYRNDLVLAQSRVEQARATEDCRNAMVQQWCRVSIAASRSRGEQLDEATRTTCLHHPQDHLTVAHRMAIAAGDFEEARRLEGSMADIDPSSAAMDKPPSPPLLFARFVRLTAEGQWEESLAAAKQLQARGTPFTQREWFERLMIDLGSARSLRELGRANEALALEHGVATVNAEFAKLFRETCTERPSGSETRHLLCPAGMY